MGTRYKGDLTDHPLRFITTTFNQWLQLLIDDSYFNIITDSLNFTSRKYSVDILAYVIMPNHLHLVLFFYNEVKVSDYMRDFKKFTSGEIRRKLLKDGEADLLKKLEHSSCTKKYKIWMDRFDDFVIKNPKMLHIKMNYIHENPVRKQLSETAENYPYSSASFYQNEKKGNVEVKYYLDSIGWGNHFSYGRI